MVVKECKASEFLECQIVFSGLDHDVAGPIGAFSSAALPNNSPRCPFTQNAAG